MKARGRSRYTRHRSWHKLRNWRPVERPLASEESIMQFQRTFKTAMHALRRNVMRSALTCLGIIIGVGAVIAMMEIGHGSSSAIQKQIASMGANNLMIFPGTAASGGVSWGAGSTVTLIPADADAILRECPSVRAVAPVVQSRAQIVYGSKNWV